MAQTEKPADLPEAVSPENILVAVPALNEESAIAECLHSLMADSPFMANTTVVVADGGSTDRTLAILKDLQAIYPNLHVLHNPVRLQSAGINAVVKEFASEHHTILVRCDAHATYPPAYVEQVANGLDAQPDAASLAVPMDSVGTACFDKAAAWVVDTKLGSGGSAHRGGKGSHWVDHGHHAGFRLNWFNKVGGYDPTFSHNEDAEYDHRIGLAGGKVWLDADIRLDYHMRQNLPKLAKQYWTYGRGRARTILKHRMRPRPRQMIPVVHTVIFAITSLLALIWPVFWLYPLFYLSVLVGVSIIGARKLDGICGLWAGPALGAMHLSWGAGFLRQLLAQAERAPQ